MLAFHDVAAIISPWPYGEACHSAPLPPEQTAVRKVLAEFPGPGAVEQYWFKAGADGSREMHYRETRMGATLVARVGGRLPVCVFAFKAGLL